MIQRLLSFAQKTIEKLFFYLSSSVVRFIVRFNWVFRDKFIRPTPYGLLGSTRRHVSMMLSSEQLVPEIRKDWFTQAELRLAKRFSQLGLFGVILRHSIIASKINHKP